MPKLNILGTRGIPAQHGGFETFAERLALYLVSKGWDVTVYCQEFGKGSHWRDEWKGVNLVHVPVRQPGSLGSLWFDLKSTRLASRSDGVVLSLGYNTAAFSFLYRLRKIVNLINMDGIEWRRQKWSLPARGWLLVNEILGCWLGNHLIADHPEIARHLATRISADKITMIPYGADEIGDEPSASMLTQWGLESDRFALVVARPEPENSILEIVSAYSRTDRSLKLVVLGNYRPDENPYHRKVLEAARDDVIFPGAIYDKGMLSAFRRHCRYYVHGHQAGGTNPSLVEALGAGSAILAHGNKYNRWVAGEEAAYFATQDDCRDIMQLLAADDRRIARMRRFSRQRHLEMFTWEKILSHYEALLHDWSGPVTVGEERV